MKVLILRTFPNKLNTNSYNIQEIGLAKALRNNGVIADIVFYNGLSKSKKEITPEGITIYWQTSFNFFKNGIFLNLSKILSNYDVIQVHEYDQIQSWFLYTFYSKKKIVIYHGPYFDSFNKGYNLKCHLFDLFFLRFSGKAKKNITCLTKSPFAADFLQRKGFKNVYSLGVGLDLKNHSKIDASKKYAISPNNFNALYVGKLEERRNISFLLDLANKAHALNNSFKLTIIGKFDSNDYKSKMLPRLNQLVAAGVISYFESASQDELPSVYEASDIFLFTSNYDIFGMVLLEAMYYGSVPISTMNGGAKTLIDNKTNGYIIDNYSVDQWNFTINNIIKNREHLQILKKNAHDTIASQYTWDKLALKFIDHYQC